MGWFSTFTRTTTANISSATTEAIGCSGASINIEHVYISGANHTSASIIVKNTGFYDFTNISSMLINKTGGTCNQSPSSVSLSKGSVTTLSLTCPDYMFDSEASVTEETFTVDLNNWVKLAKTNIKSGSETVKNSTGGTPTYVLNLTDGGINITGGDTDGATANISYTYYTDNITLFSRAVVTTECGGVDDVTTDTNDVTLSPIN